jgi:hypothetical protein
MDRPPFVNDMLARVFAGAQGMVGKVARGFDVWPVRRATVEMGRFAFERGLTG